jgi:glycosyltransferase involved in cell wall biosynthesis
MPVVRWYLRMANFLPVAVVPVYNHPHTIAATVDALRAQGLPCVMVDDGSDAVCAQVLDGLGAADAQVDLLRLPHNQGKGAAMAAGLRRAQILGYSHALQIDADGQHDTADVARFIALAKAHPQAVICGCPQYDHSVPRLRFYARYLTHILVWFNTRSLAIRDSMCGFRVYPVDSAVAVFDTETVGQRMDFDSEIIVHLYWRKVPIINQTTRVIYPENGISHYRLWRDTALLARMHARLFVGMLQRLCRT